MFRARVQRKRHTDDRGYPEGAGRKSQQSEVSDMVQKLMNLLLTIVVSLVGQITASRANETAVCINSSQGSLSVRVPKGLEHSVADERDRVMIDNVKPPYVYGGFLRSGELSIVVFSFARANRFGGFSTPEKWVLDYVSHAHAIVSIQAKRISAFEGFLLEVAKDEQGMRTVEFFGSSDAGWWLFRLTAKEPVTGIKDTSMLLRSVVEGVVVRKHKCENTSEIR